MPYYDVEVIYKAGHSTRVYATNQDDAKARAIKEAEMSGDCLEVLKVEATRDGSQKVDASSSR